MEITAFFVPGSLQAWPDALHITLLRHLGGPRLVSGYLRPYRSLCRACAAAVLLPTLWREIDLEPFTDLEIHALIGLLDFLSCCCAGVLERLALQNLDLQDEHIVGALEPLLAGSCLKVLDLGKCSELSASMIAALCKLSRLEELVLECNKDLCDADLAHLCTSLSSLNCLDISFCESLFDISPLVIRPVAWRSLQLDGCFRLDVGQLLESAPSSWTNLEKLSLDGEELSCHQLALVAEVCPCLRSFSVSHAEQLEPCTLVRMATLSQLTALTLKKATKPTDYDWASFLVSQLSRRKASDVWCHMQSSYWEILNFAECEHFADQALAALAGTPQPFLLELDLSWCWHLTDTSVRELLFVSQQLQRVRLQGLKGLTAGALLAPCCRLSKLEELDCTSCNSVADDVLEFLFRLFLAPPASARGLEKPRGRRLPPFDDLPPRVSAAAAHLWRQRSRALPRLLIKNYFGEDLQDWEGVPPVVNVCDGAEALLRDLGDFGHAT